MDIKKLTVRSSEIDKNTGRIILPSSVRKAQGKNSDTPENPTRYAAPLPPQLATPTFQVMQDPPAEEFDQALEETATPPTPAAKTTAFPQAAMSDHTPAPAVSDMFRKYAVPFGLFALFLLFIPLTIAITFLFVKNHALTKEIHNLREDMGSNAAIVSDMNSDVDLNRDVIIEHGDFISTLQDDVKNIPALLTGLEFVIEETPANTEIVDEDVASETSEKEDAKDTTDAK